MKKVLILDRSSDFVQKVKNRFKNEFQIYSASRISSGFQRIFESSIDLILVSTTVNDSDLFNFLLQINRLSPEIQVVVMDGEHDPRRESRFLRYGARSYIEKPMDVAELTPLFSRTGTEELQAPPDGGKLLLNRIIGTSSSTVRMKQQILSFAQNDAPVLLLGESGTGKDLAAWCIHHLSARNSHRYVALNCAALPGSLIASELFGTERGAFTGALSSPGKFELSHRGTLFLDEISEISTDAQANLLRILESRTVTRLGGQREIHIDCRIITATNRNLKEEVRQNRFRRDLLYRINTLFLEMSPLRQRKEDIPILAEHFLEAVEGNREKSFSPNAVEKLCEHSWPGNIRELKNVVERSYYCSAGQVIRSSEVQFFSG